MSLRCRGTLATLAALVALGCSDSLQDLTEPRGTYSITTTPGSIELVQDHDLQLSAAVHDDTRGQAYDAIRVFTLRSQDTTVVTVDSTGRVLAVGPGTTELHLAWKANYGVDTTVAVTVTADPVALVHLTPATVPTLYPGDSVRLTATVKNGAGAVLPIRARTWSSSATSVATADQSGWVFGVAPGTANITVRSETEQDVSAVTVVARPVAMVGISPALSAVAAGGAVQLRATPRAANGEALTGRPITWQTSDPSIATVDSTGYVTAVGSGWVTITATSEGQSGTARVAVDN